MRNPIQKFRQSSIAFEKPCFLSEKLKLLTSSNYHRVQYFLLKLCTLFLLTDSQKRVVGIFFLFSLDLELFAEIKNDMVSKHSFFTFLLITQDLNKTKQNPGHSFIDIVKQETCAKFHQKISNFSAVGALQSFQFSRPMAWSLGNNRVLSKSRYRILYNLISITKL